MKQTYFVFTGAPGAGKTTLLDCLEKKGYVVVPEVARNIIREQVAKNGNALPWKNTMQYQQLMAAQTITAFETAPDHSALCLFDRGIPDVVAYSRLIGITANKTLHNAALNLRYNKRVFIFPPWKEIYTTDTERKQSFEEAISTFQLINEVYSEYGYEPIVIPFGSVEERALFVIKAMQQFADDLHADINCCNDNLC